MSRSRSIFAGGRKVAEFLGDELVWHDPEYYTASKRSTEIAAPMIIKDIGEYKSPLDGSMITSRSSHRAHMRQHDVIEVGNEPIGAMTKVAEAPASSRDIGETIKRRIEEVQAMPQRQYDEHVQIKQAEVAETAAMITAG